MTETRTNRHDLPQWSAGTDSGSRADFNEAFDKLNDQAAYDDGVDAATLPVSGVVAGRYALVTLAGGYRTLHRRAADAAWDPIGGNTMPRAFHYRALEGQARTDTAVAYSHPGSANPGATFDYGGSAVLSGTVRIHDDDEPTRGALVVGTSAAVDLPTLGRVHVRTRAENERGIVVRPYTPGVGDPVGNLFTTQTAGGVDAFSLDALSRLRQQAASGFGGASIPTTSMVAISPTSSDSDTVTNGLLLYGQAGVSAVTAKTLLRIQPDNTVDTAPIGLVTRTGIGLGRLPWGTPGTALGTLTYAGNTHNFRVSGSVDNTSYFTVRKSDVTSPVTEADTTKDIGLFAVGSTAVTSSLPLSVSQRQRTTSTTMALYRVSDFNAPFLELARLVPDGGGVEQAQLASTWTSDGRLSSGAWWRGTGVLRDARQPVRHMSRKWYATPEQADTVGQSIESGTTFTYTWAQMTVRSPSATELEVRLALELITIPSPDQVDTNSFLLETLISVNGGGYVVGDATHCTLPLTQSAARLGGTVVTASHRIATTIPTGAVFILRTRITMYDSIPDMRLRMLDVVATEAIHEVYAAP